MKNLFDFFFEFYNQMTLGSNKTLIFSAFTKNESKKRKSSEVMNGFMREDSLQTIGFTDNFVNERNESNDYEIPSKRSRIEIVSNMSSDLNSRKETTKPKNKVMSIFESTWNKFKNRNGVNNNSQNVSILPNNNVFNMTSSGSNAIETNATNNQRIAINQSCSSNIKPMSSQLTQSFENNTSNRNKKGRFRQFLNLCDKRRYQQLLNRHTPQAIVEKSFVRKVDSPAIIDLTFEKSVVTSNNNTKTSQQLFKTESLDKDSKVNVINRIKTQGVVAPTLTIKKPLFSTLYNNNNDLNRFSSNHSTPKFNAFNRKIEETLPKSPDLTSNSVSITSVPETSKQFNNLIETKKDYLNSEFISDLRSSLITSTESDDRKITKSETILNGFQNKRQTNCESLRNKLKSPMTRTELIQPYTCIPFISFDDKIEDEEEEEEEDEESSPSDFPVLTADMNREIDSALRSTPPNEVLSDGITGQICRKDMETLKGLNWLNDEIINFYLSLIVERGKNDNYPTVHAFNTFFYTKLRDNGPQSLKRWTRKLDVFSNHFIFIPIHLGMHWCLAVIDFVNKKIEYYDSMGGNNMECVHALKAWLQAESLDKKKCEFPMTDWTLQMAKDIPQQMNGSDCGMFSCKYAEYISRKAKINFSQAHMPYFRRRMVYEILTKQLL